MDTAIFLLDHTAAVLFSNDHAARLLQSDDRVLVVQGKLTFTCAACTAKLIDCLTPRGKQRGASKAKAKAKANSLAHLPASSSGSALTVRLAAMNAQLATTTAGSPAGLVEIRQANAPRFSQESLCVLFGLTKKEGSVAEALANGLSVEEAAVVLGITGGTARTHLNNCLSKTNTNRQAQLVSLIWRCSHPLNK